MIVRYNMYKHKNGRYRISTKNSGDLLATEDMVIIQTGWKFQELKSDASLSLWMGNYYSHLGKLNNSKKLGLFDPIITPQVGSVDKVIEIAVNGNVEGLELELDIETRVYHKQLTEEERFEKLVDDTDRFARVVFESLQKISKTNKYYDLAVIHMAGVIRQLDGLK